MFTREFPNTEVKNSLPGMVNSGLNLARFGYKESPEWTRMGHTS